MQHVILWDNNKWDCNNDHNHNDDKRDECKGVVWVLGSDFNVKTHDKWDGW
jgi:hypothetical protein